MTVKPSRVQRGNRKAFFDEAPYTLLWVGIQIARVLGMLPENLSDFCFFNITRIYRRVKNLVKLN